MAETRISSSPAARAAARSTTARSRSGSTIATRHFMRYDGAVFDLQAERCEQVHALDPLRASGELHQICLVRGVVRPGRPGDDEHRGAATATEDRGRVDRRLDPFAPRESHRKKEERVRVEQAQPLREAEAGRSEAQDVADIDAVRDDLEVVSRETGE